MAQKRARRRFTREYKAQAVQRVMEKSGRPLADIAAELDVSPGQLSQWRNEQLAAVRTVSTALLMAIERLSSSSISTIDWPRMRPFCSTVIFKNTVRLPALQPLGCFAARTSPVLRCASVASTDRHPLTRHPQPSGLRMPRLAAVRHTQKRGCGAALRAVRTG